MPDHATSDHPGVQAQLDRLARLGPGTDILGLERITRLLARLGNPHEAMPPVFHVAGTNGKGSTCAYLRAAVEAAGLTAHVYTSPHLVRFNERIRIAGQLIDDSSLAALLAEVLDAADGIGASFFEVTTAAAFLAFARTPAAACIVEVGLGGRLDATNVIARPLVTGIAALGFDHQQFLGDTLLQIAGEKAGIAKPDVPLVTMAYEPLIRARIAKIAGASGAQLIEQGPAWTVRETASGVVYEDPAFRLAADRPRLPGAHQVANWGLAVAMLRHQGRLAIPEAALRAAADWARWPARMQRLATGPLTARLPDGVGAWLDGSHNPSAAVAVASVLAALPGPVHLVIGMLANKDLPGTLAPLARVASGLTAVPVAGHAHHAPEAIAAEARRLGLAADTAPDVATAFDRLAGPTPASVAVLGSLYLAGEVLRLNDEPPD